jgi:hypothetical protein
VASRGAPRACGGSRQRMARAMAGPPDAFVTCNKTAVSKLRALLAQPGLLQVWTFAN